MWFWVFVLYVIVVLIVLNSKYVISLINFKRRIDFSKTIPGPEFRELLKNAKKESKYLIQYCVLFGIMAQGIYLVNYAW